jgi:hypothetical protein
MVFVSRSRGGPDRFFRIKLILFVAAGVLIVLGVRLETSSLIWGAVGMLLIAVGLRFFRQPNRVGANDDGRQVSETRPPS